MPKKILIVFGTRPEAIKMCPLILPLEDSFTVKTCHRPMYFYEALSASAHKTSCFFLCYRHLSTSLLPLCAPNMAPRQRDSNQARVHTP